LCGMTIFFSLVYTAKPSVTVAELLYGLSLPGALAALLTPDWTALPLFNFHALHSFIIHGMEMTFPLMLLAAREIRPNWRNLWRSCIFLLVTAPPIYFFNKAAGTNFFFLNTPAPHSPLSVFEQLLGNPGYILGLLGLLFAVWLVMYAPFAVAGRKAAKKP